MTKINSIKDVKVENYSVTGRVEVNGIVAKSDSKHPKDSYNIFVCFGYQGKEFALDNWASKTAKGLSRNNPPADKRLLWNSHQFFIKYKIENQTKLHRKEYRNLAESELGNISWLGLVESAYNAIQANQEINIIYLSQHDYDSAKLYYDYCNWLKTQI